MSNELDDQQADELIRIPYEAQDRTGAAFLRQHRIAEKQASTANWMAIVLVLAFAVSVFAYIAAHLILVHWIADLASNQENPPQVFRETLEGATSPLSAVFERWLAVLAALVGAAFGFYFRGRVQERRHG